MYTTVLFCNIIVLRYASYFKGVLLLFLEMSQVKQMQLSWLLKLLQVRDLESVTFVLFWCIHM